MTGSPFPIGAFTKSKNSFSGQLEYKLAALAVSMTEPPPTARNVSKSPFFAKLIAFSKLKASHIFSKEFFQVTSVLFTCICHHDN